MRILMVALLAGVLAAPALACDGHGRGRHGFGRFGFAAGHRRFGRTLYAGYRTYPGGVYSRWSYRAYKPSLSHPGYRRYLYHRYYGYYNPPVRGWAGSYYGGWAAGWGRGRPAYLAGGCGWGYGHELFAYHPYGAYFVRPVLAIAPIYSRYGASLTLADDVLERAPKRDKAAAGGDGKGASKGDAETDGDGVPQARERRVGERFLSAPAK